MNEYIYLAGIITILLIFTILVLLLLRAQYPTLPKEPKKSKKRKYTWSDLFNEDLTDEEYNEALDDLEKNDPDYS